MLLLYYFEAMKQYINIYFAPIDIKIMKLFTFPLEVSVLDETQIICLKGIGSHFLRRKTIFREILIPRESL